MMGVQIGGGEWLFGPEITARYGGGLMWLATVAIVLQVFYNLEVGRYALYCGEPIFTGFLRSRPGPRFWVPFFIMLSLGAIVPGLAFHAASIITALALDRPPTADDRGLVVAIAFGCTAIVFLPVLFGKKIYNTLQAVMTAKVIGVLTFCLLVGCTLVKWEAWREVFSGFAKFGNVPSPDAKQGQDLVNVFRFRILEGRFPRIGLADIAVIGGFIGFAGGGGLGNSLYGNYVRDKGWGNGAHVGAIASAFGGRTITLSHLGKAFPAVGENLIRWKGWWRVIIIDQAAIWAPGCFVGMALPALLSLQFAPHASGLAAMRQGVAQNEFTPSATTSKPAVDIDHDAPAAGPSRSQTASSGSRGFQWAAAMVTADGMRHDPRLTFAWGQLLWTAMLLAGLLVLLPSQMSVVDEVCRRWTDVIWSASSHIRAGMHGDQAKLIYYALAACYFIWCAATLYFFGVYGTPRLMTIMIGNLGNLAMGLTSFHILWINTQWLPPEIRPGRLCCSVLAICGAFYLGVAALVFYETQWPLICQCWA